MATIYYDSDANFDLLKTAYRRCRRLWRARTRAISKPQRQRGECCRRVI